jgi:hypothetical protein
VVLRRPAVWEAPGRARVGVAAGTREGGGCRAKKVEELGFDVPMDRNVCTNLKQCEFQCLAPLLKT